MRTTPIVVLYLKNPRRERPVLISDRVILSFISLVALFGCLQHSIAQENCSDILLRDLGNKTVVQDNQNSVLATHHARCALASSGSSNSSGTKVGGHYGPIGGNYGQSNSSGQYQNTSDCGNESLEQQTSAALYYASSIYRDVVDAWKSCMLQREQFACWALPAGDPKHVVIRARWGILSARPSVTSSSLSIGSQATRPLFEKGHQLYLKDNNITVDRLSNESITVSLTATSDNVHN
jgi:hypothetical protein